MCGPKKPDVPMVPPPPPPPPPPQAAKPATAKRAIAEQNAAGRAEGEGTLLTGVAGVDPAQLALQRNTLLGS